ncbi:L,D-transpeptidase family protein [Sphingomonas rubra]|uniref:L,D-transpeptidase catalytic domain n=1 Tax=Sphingomonas rubra TaxID=634430 RepID=A0A1I5T9L6_9SPHN|nr:L,D-transpeptidase family protein [Sphingomonas rubra]SFP79668.1 L,D-transpeptidase catalytic domain [Sphingomonas rubra]
MKHLFLALAAAATLSASPALASDAALAVDAAASTLQPNKFVWSAATEMVAADPVTVVVSIPQQRAFVYRGDTLVAASSVSTGKEGNDTPIGIYPILQKNEKHFSNLYNSAPMPFMQRLTWDGIALHAGKNPGFPDSHGCVRLPAEFAKRLFSITDLGTTVVVTDQDVYGDRLDRDLLMTDAMRANGAQLAALTR